MSRKILALPLVLIVTGALFVNYASANNPAPPESQPPTGGRSIGGAVLPGYPSPDLMVITTNVPMQIPGRVLQPGAYDFKLINSDDEVLVSAATNHQIYGAFLVIPVSRARTTNHAQVTVAESPDGGPNRIAAWFFPGATTGYGFLYPKKMHNATTIAMKK